MTPLDVLPPAFLLTLVATLGLIFGSFVSALSFRLPRGVSIVSGRSMCPSCGTSLTARDLVPVLSWLSSRGKCRTCGSPISWRYPAIEMATAGMFMTAAIFEHDLVRLVLLLGTAPAIVALAVIDIEHRRLPNALLFWLLIFAVGLRFIGDRDFVQALATAAIVFGAAIALDVLGRRWFREGLGMGDAKLMAVTAVALPPIPFLTMVAGAGALAVAAGLTFWLSTRHRGQIPFGPPVLIAFWVALLVL